MKKILFAIAALLVAIPQIKAQAPLAQGVIAYDMTIDLRAQVAKKNPAMAAMVPKETHVKMTLSFKNEIFGIVNEAVTSKEKGNNMSMQLSAGGDEKRIIDLKKHTAHSEYVISSKKYYTEESLQPSKNISYTRETKTLLGYTVTKAIVTEDGKTYTAWFTTQLPYAYSPEPVLFSGLKGAVLEYSAEDYTCRAVSINANGFKQAAITADAAARKITAEQLQDLQDDAMGEQMKPATKSSNGQQATQKVIIKL